MIPKAPSSLGLQAKSQAARQYPFLLISPDSKSNVFYTCQSAVSVEEGFEECTYKRWGRAEKTELTNINLPW
jgi:hypothetical protein